MITLLWSMSSLLYARFPFNHVSFVCSDLVNETHVVWFDNFSHSYAAQLQGIANGAYKSCLWTGEAWRKVRPNVNVSMEFRDQKTTPTPWALPDELMSPFNMELVGTLMTDVDDAGMWMYNDSVVRRYKVVRVPLKPSLTEVKRQGKSGLLKCLLEKRDGITGLCTRRMIDINISSTRGLTLIMRQFWEERKASSKKRYSLLCVDSNIFMRVLKVHSAYLGYCIYVNCQCITILSALFVYDPEHC
jgi:hypothetical protein